MSINKVVTLPASFDRYVELNVRSHLMQVQPTVPIQYMYNSLSAYSGGPIPSVFEAAVMAQHIYDATKKDYYRMIINGWTLEDILKNDEGLKMGVYSKVTKGGTIGYALVNKGTSTRGDWGNNVQQPVGYSDDMKESISKSTKFVNAHKNNEVTMVGHSKGGAEAIANAVANNKTAITFNTAIPDLDAYDLNADGYNASMTHYVVKGEILNATFGKPSIGQMTYLPTQPIKKCFEGGRV